MPLHKIEKILAPAETKDTFFRRIERIYSPYSKEYGFIYRAYIDAENAFSDIYRDNGDVYFTHVRAVAIILIDYLYIFDRGDLTISIHEIIAAALLHDVIEDRPDEWSLERINRDYSKNTTLIVDCVSKKPLSYFNDSVEDQLDFYHTRLSTINIVEVILLKLSDRLHNQTTLWNCNTDKIRRKMEETINIYIVLAKKWGVLVHELEKTVEGFEERLKMHMKQCEVSTS
ncbi:MAG: hypothetical protein CR972_04945 [Candidatus Moraniibacteriota bacterium]|nr:MAG: hypothetical protein CR972_04945 [Candidatus Moranbacteria bacterium]